MKKGEFLAAILRSKKTVLTIQDIALLWRETVTQATRVRINYYVKKGELIQLRKGIYAKSLDYNRLELATSILKPAYVSFETVLAAEGLIFQVYEKIFAASYASREVIVDQQIYSYRKLKDPVLVNPLGIELTQETSIATPERAFLDTLYIHADYHFDSLLPLDWDKVYKILPLYTNLRMEGRVYRLRAEVLASQGSTHTS
jgi:predicted transcriptional regulator of viral defense system